MFKFDGIKHFINTKFRDKIIDVKMPREDWFTYEGVNILESYIVTVVYKYAGPKDTIFDIDVEEEIDPEFFKYSQSIQDRLSKFSQQRTLESARDFYAQTCAKMEQQKMKKAKRHVK